MAGSPRRFDNHQHALSVQTLRDTRFLRLDVFIVVYRRIVVIVFAASLSRCHDFHKISSTLSLKSKSLLSSEVKEDVLL